MKYLNTGNLIMVPWCDQVDNEEKIKELSKEQSLGDENASKIGLSGAAKSLCIPFDLGLFST